MNYLSQSSTVNKPPSNPLLLSQTKKMKKNVSFSPTAHAKRTLHIRNYTDEEIKATWYTDDEMDNIREEIRRTVVELLVAGGDLKKKKKYCTRGLESCCTPELKQKRIDNKIVGRDAVLEEQYRQQEYHGIVDCEEIAKVYKAASSHCQVAAYMMGAADEKAVAPGSVSSRRKHSSSPMGIAQSEQVRKHGPIVNRQHTMQKNRAM